MQGMRSKDPGRDGGDFLVPTEIRGSEQLHKQTLPWPGDCMSGRKESQFPKVESESSRADYYRRRPGHGSPEAVTAFRSNYGLVGRGLDSRTRRGTACQDEEGKDGEDVSHELYLVHENKFLKGTGRTDDKEV